MNACFRLQTSQGPAVGTEASEPAPIRRHFAAVQDCTTKPTASPALSGRLAAGFRNPASTPLLGATPPRFDRPRTDDACSSSGFRYPCGSRKMRCRRCLPELALRTPACCLLPTRLASSLARCWRSEGARVPTPKGRHSYHFLEAACRTMEEAGPQQQQPRPQRQL